MRILIPTMTYGRKEVYKAFEQGIKELQDAYPEHEIDCLVVGSGDEFVNFEYHDYPNDPLSNKADYRLRLCKDRADYYLFLGSDDIIRPDTLKYYLTQMEKGVDWIAPMDICHSYKGEVYYSEGYPDGHYRKGESLAVGRCLSNDILNKLDWSLWRKTKFKNIDRQAYELLDKYCDNKHFFKLEDAGLIIDIKTEDSLSKFEGYRFTKIGTNEEYLSKEVCELIEDTYNDIHESVVIYPNVEIESGVKVEAGTVLGAPGALRHTNKREGKLIIKKGAKIGANCVICIGEDGETIIGENTLVMNLCNIGHDVKIGRDCEIGAKTIIAGHTEIGDNVKIKIGCNVRNRLKICNNVTIGMGSNVVKDINKPGVYWGNPCPDDKWNCYQ